jgi:micrococcal nuclease
MIFRCILTIVILSANLVHAKGEFWGHVSHVTDGDTLWVQPDTGGPSRKLRIDGIDAPEICQTGGAASRAELVRLALHQRVAVSVRQQDDYGRGLAHIQLETGDLGEQMVRAGQAWSYRWRQSLGPYAAEEAVARQSRRGLFAADAIELPRDFRQRHGSCYEPKE